MWRVVIEKGVLNSEQQYTKLYPTGGPSVHKDEFLRLRNSSLRTEDPPVGYKRGVISFPYMTIIRQYRGGRALFFAIIMIEGGGVMIRTGLR